MFDLQVISNHAGTDRGSIIQTMRAKSSRESLSLPFDRSLFHPGQRVCVAVSGGADSTALVRAICAASGELGIVISALHVHHGIRAAEADGDAAFVAALAQQLGVACEVVHVDTPTRAAQKKQSIETTARNLRYEVFRRLLHEKKADAVATAHTLDDQAETVLMKLLRGAWTEGLGGIHPTLLEQGTTAGEIIRPLLSVRRVEIESYLRALVQPWREDGSNRDLVHTRNRLRHNLLPVLREYNPNLDRQLARMATIARDEEAYWQNELARILPGLLLPGKPTRGGGRSVSTDPNQASLAMEVSRLLAYPPAIRRRILRAAVQQLQQNLPDTEEAASAFNFDHTEALLQLVQGTAGHATRRLQLGHAMMAERTARELRLEHVAAPAESASPNPQYELPIPGEMDAVAYGLRFVAICNNVDAPTLPAATIRAWQPGDRVTLQHSRGPKKVKEVLERMHILGRERERWPVVAWQGNLVWMQGVIVAPTLVAGAIPFKIQASPLVTSGSGGKS